MTNVVSFGNANLPEPEKEVVEVLEEYFDQARRGEIIGIAVALVRPNDVTGSSWHVLNGFRNSLIAAQAWLQHRLLTAMDESDEP